MVAGPGLEPGISRLWALRDAIFSTPRQVQSRRAGSLATATTVESYKEYTRKLGFSQGLSGQFSSDSL